MKPKRRQIRIKFVVTGESVLAEMLDDEAPGVCEHVWNCLPVQTKTLHGMYSGAEVFTVLDNPRPAPRENLTQLPLPGEILYFYDDANRVLMMWRHRFILDRWVWELPGGYLDPNEDPAVCAVREVEEETGWRPRSMTLLTRFQPLVGSADFENLIFLGEGAEDTGRPADINEVARVEWITLDSIRNRIGRVEIIGAGTQIGLLHLLAFRSH